jgi:polyhydroxyalkanoate synthesis regulator phasin
MKEERLRILTMLQEGKITPEEAERLLAALSGGGRADPGEGPGRGRRPRGFWDFDFDFTRGFDPEFRRFGTVFDDEFRRKFQDKMRHFRHSMRCADEESRREARDALRDAAEAVKNAFEQSNIKETVEGIGKTVLDAMEEAMRRFGGEKTEKTGSGDAGPGEPRKPEDGGPTATA